MPRTHVKTNEAESVCDPSTHLVARGQIDTGPFQELKGQLAWLRTRDLASRKVDIQSSDLHTWAMTHTCLHSNM